MLFNTTKVPIKVINIEQDGSHIFISALVNAKPATLLIDTGASRSVFDLNRIRQFEEEKEFLLHQKLSTGLGTNSMPTQGIVVENFTLGKLSIDQFDVVLLDLQHVNDSYSSMGLAPIDGVLGNDILVRYKAVIDLGKNSLTLDLDPHLL